MRGWLVRRRVRRVVAEHTTAMRILDIYQEAGSITADEYASMKLAQINRTRAAVGLVKITDDCLAVIRVAP